MGFDSWDVYDVGEQNLYPGPIDNSGLFSGTVPCCFSNCNVHWGQLRSWWPEAVFIPVCHRYHEPDFLTVRG